MGVLLLIAVLSQANAERNPMITIKSGVFREIEAATTIVEKIVQHGNREQLAAELIRLDRKYDPEKTPDVNMVFMAHILSAISSEDGPAMTPWIRESCEPYALAIAGRPLKPPTDSELLESQLIAFHCLAKTRYSKEADKREVEVQRRISRMKLLAQIWARVVESQIAISREYSDELVERVNHGDEFLQMPPFPKSPPGSSLMAGQSPNTIRDPKLKQDYVDYLKKCQDAQFKFSKARGLYDLRRGIHLGTTRRYLEFVYGADRKTWVELRKVVEETVPDKELAQHILKDLTRRKDP